MADTFVLVTSADVELRKTDAPLTEWVTHPANGVTATPDHLALINFRGVPSNRMQEQTQVLRRIALALPDMVELRDGLDHLIRTAVNLQLMRLPR